MGLFSFLSKKPAQEPETRNDGWASTVTGIGTAVRDKAQSYAFTGCQQVSDEVLEAMYYGDDLANRIVSAPVDEAMRQGFELEPADETKPKDDAEEGKLWDACEALSVPRKFAEAATWGRLFGGAALWMGANDGAKSDEPLSLERAKSFDFLHVLDKRDMTPLSFYVDPASPKFGHVEKFQVTLSAMGGTTVTAVVHESRLILFGGAPTSARERAKMNGWDHSVLHAVYDTLRMANANWAAVSTLMGDASQAVYKVKGLIETLAAGEESTMRERMEMVEYGRSTLRALIMDADGEDFTRIATPMGGLPEMVDRSWQRVASGSRTPMTVLFGMSPAGMNATGESDTRHWYDQVKSYQEHDLRPRLLRLVRAIAVGIGLDPLAWDVCFPSLWQTTEKERAEVRKLVADTDAVYIAQGVLLPEEVALSRFGASGYSTETHVDLDARQAMLEAETQKAVDSAGKPDPAPPVAPPPPGAPVTTETPDEEAKEEQEAVA
jgi:phage-related protein (TIGR01555 family)